MDKTAWGVVSIAIFSAMVASASVGKVPPALPLLREGLDLTLVQGGWVMSTFSTLGSLCAIFFGGACDRLGAMRFALLGFACLVAGALLGACAQGYGLLIASRILEGSGYIAVVVAMPGLITRCTAPRDYRLVLGLWSTYLPFGTAAAMVAAPFLLQHMGWRGLWLVMGAVALACAVLLFRVRDRFPPPAAHPRPALGMIAETLRRPGAWLLSCTFPTYAVQWFTLMVWLPSFLIEQRGLSPVLAATLTAAVVAANLPGNVIGGWLVHRNVSRGGLIAACAFCMLLCGAGIFNDQLPDTLRYLLCLLFTFVGGMIPAAGFSGMMFHAPSPGHMGTLNGLVVQLSNLGQFIGPPAVAAAVTAAGNWSGAQVVMGTAAVAGILVGSALALFEKRAVARAACTLPVPQAQNAD